MPERTPDNNGTWMFQTVFPGADLKKNPIAVDLPNLVEAVGFDGRFVGALRPFPGMADKTIHGVPSPSGSTTITSISNIVFAKYAAIQKGISGDTLKGIVLIGDNPGATGQAVYFAYRDSSDASEDVVMLEDLDSWDDFKVNATLNVDKIDVTSLGRYIYFSASVDTTSTVTSFSNQEPPYNKAYFWDYKINTWDKFVTGFDGRFMGLLPRRVLDTRLNEDDSPASVKDSDNALEAQIYSPTNDLPVGRYTYAAELISRKHNLRSYLRMDTEDLTSAGSLRWQLARINLPVDSTGGDVNQLNGNAHSNTCVINWGIPHCDGFRLWRTVVDTTTREIGKYEPLGLLYAVDQYLEKGQHVTTSSTLTLQVGHSNTNDGAKDLDSTFLSDGGLVQQQQFDAFFDEWGPAPRFKRLVAYDELLVGITDITELASPDKDWQPSQQKPETLAWSALVQREPENFPVANVYEPDNAAEKFLALEPAGDHLFAVSNAGIYRISRSGAQMGINRLQYRIGGVSRFGATGVGNSLFVVTRSGLKEIDGNTGSIRSVPSLDRIILDDSEWAPDLVNVHLEYDALLGALILLNTTKKEMYIMWEATGAVNKVEDCPWSFLTSGPDVLTDGPHRAYFITSDASIHVIDGAREMGKWTMCGTTASETVNGTLTSAPDSTSIIDSTATFPVNCVGFKVYTGTGNLTDEVGTITARNSATDLTVSGLSGTPAVGDRYSIAPVITRGVLPSLVSQGGQVDAFVRKVGTGMSIAFSDLANETDDANNGKITLGLKENLTTRDSAEVAFNLIPSKTAVRVNAGATRLYPFFESRGSNMDFEVQAIMIKGVLSQSEAQDRQGTA